MKIVTVTGYKGGVGKSTTAIHVATYLSEHGDAVLVDGDPNRTSVNWSARGSLPFDVADERKAMKAVQGRDFVVIDTPARPGSEDLKMTPDAADRTALGIAMEFPVIKPQVNGATEHIRSTAKNTY